MTSVLTVLVTMNLIGSLILIVYVFYIMKRLNITDKEIMYSFINKRR